MPAAVKTASRMLVNGLARSRMRNRNWSACSPRFIRRLRAACAVQAPAGLVVTPSTWTQRVPTSIDVPDELGAEADYDLIKTRTRA